MQDGFARRCSGLPCGGHFIRGRGVRSRAERCTHRYAACLDQDRAGDGAAFPQERRAVGNIDFNQDLLTQVFTQYQGRIIQAFAKVGDIVKKDQPLFTIDSPDLLQAESTLISAAGVMDLTTKNLERQRNLYRQTAAAQKDYEQAISDQQAADGA